LAAALALDRILLTDDDGIDAPGLAVLEAVAAELAAEIWVVAPEHDQSGQSHAISLHHPIRVSPRGPRRFSVTGTPGDCAVMGIRHLLPEAPSLVLSGVNRGANLGIETVFSGTVGGAMTAMMLGIPAIALSQGWRGGRADALWETARTLAPETIASLLRTGWPADTCLNLNFPDRPAADALPLVLARQGVGIVQSIDVEARVDPRGLSYHWLRFRRGARTQAPESDSDALDAGHVVVTPLRYDRTDEDAYARMADALPRFGA
jgi:5'-nucleotidase